MLNSKKKSIRKEIENSPDTLKSKKRLLDLYLAKTTLIFNIFKNAYQILIQHKISKKIMYSIKFFKYFFFGGGGLMVISPILYRQFATVWTILKLFLLQYCY